MKLPDSSGTERVLEIAGGDYAVLQECLKDAVLAMYASPDGSEDDDGDK